MGGKKEDGILNSLKGFSIINIIGSFLKLGNGMGSFYFFKFYEKLYTPVSKYWTLISK